MDQLLSLLKSIPEYNTVVASLKAGETVAVTGIGQINRSHMLAGLYRDLGRPMVLLCQDDMAARRLQEEWKSFVRLYWEREPDEKAWEECKSRTPSYPVRRA